MKTAYPIFVSLLLCLQAPGAPEPATPAPAKPVLKITPGQVIVPTDRMRRLWGELLSIDLATRTGKFRNESNDEVMEFKVLPYAELYHHAAFGDLQDFRIGERAIFRLHEDEAGKWVWLTYIQDEMNFLNNHKEYYYVDRLEPEKGIIECTEANFDRSYVREKGLILETEGDTRYWKQAKAVHFSDIKVGDKLRTQSHGIGKGKVRRCWEVFLDDESLLDLQAKQKAVHAGRMALQGAPGYIDLQHERELQITLFWESGEQAKQLKTGDKLWVSPAGTDRQANGPASSGIVSAAQMKGPLGKVTLTLDQPAPPFTSGSIARVWLTK